MTVWTVAYALPFHARKLYEEYGIDFGILSLQAKESKHAGLKAELSLTNRSRKSDNNKAGLKVHINIVHSSQSVTLMGNSTALKCLSVEQLKNLLRVKGLSTSGKKDILIRCLEGVVSGES